MDKNLDLAFQLADNLPLAWTFMLIMTRFIALLSAMPGIGGGLQGLRVRFPAILVFSFASLIGGQQAAVPDNLALMFAALVSEVMFGALLGFIPALIFAGVQTAMQLSSGTMGLGAAQLMDPNIGISVSSLGRIVSDTIICIFLLVGGHYSVIYAASGMAGEFIPGTFVVGATSIQMLITQTGQVFEAGVMLSAPVIVALLLTQFVMGLVTRAVPTVNIFVISFPLTIGIGLIVTMLSMPEIVVYYQREFGNVEKNTLTLAESAVLEQREATQTATPGSTQSKP